MKKILLSLLAVFMTMTASATSDWTAGDDVAYYLYNVESGMFLKATNDWGTRAGIAADGSTFKITSDDNGVIFKWTTKGNGLFFNNATSMYCDMGTQGHNVWVVNKNEDGTCTIQMTSADANYGAESMYKQAYLGYNMNYISGSSGGNNYNLVPIGSALGKDAAVTWTIMTQAEYDAVQATTAAAIDARKAAWPLVKSAKNSVLSTDAKTALATIYNPSSTAEQITTATTSLQTALLASGSEEAPVDFTFKITNPSFEQADAAGWTVTGVNNKRGGNDMNYCAESWRQSTGLTISQTISDLPNGVYKVFCQGACNDYNNTGNVPTLTANSATTVKFIGITQGESSMGAITNSFNAGLYFTEAAETTVKDGKLTIGASCTNTALWALFDNFHIQYYGPLSDAALLAEAKTAYETANTAAKGVTGKMGTSASEGLATAKSTYGDKEYTTVADYEAATTALNNAINTAKSSVAYYAVYTPWVTLYNSLDAAGKAALTDYVAKSILNDYNSGSLDEAQFPNAANTANTYFIPKVRVCVKAQTTDGADFTGAIVNPNFDGNVNGWTDTFSGKLSHGYMANAAYGTINQFMECWAGQWSGATAPYLLPNGKLYQTVTALPEGNYTLSADIIATQQQAGQDGYEALTDHSNETGIYIFASCAAGTFRSDACRNTSDAKNKTVSFTFNTTAGDCDLGLMIENTNQNWVAFDNVKLVRNGASTVNIYQEALKDEVKNATDPETITAECNATLLETYTSKYNAAKTTSETDELTDDEYRNAGTDLEDAKAALDASITAYANSKPIREAVEAGNAWTASDDFAGWSLDHEDTNFHKNTWSEEADGTGMVTPFGEYWTNGAGLADGTITYKPLSGFKAGNYAVSMLVRVYDNSGAAYDGVTFNDIDITADGVLTKVHNTGKLNGVYGVVTDVINVAADGGDLNLGFNIKSANASWLTWKGLTIKYLGTETTDASATVSVKTAGKYGTYCAPYVTAVPEGVTVYTTSATKEGSTSLLELTEVEGAIPANTPVIVYSEEAAISKATTGVAYSTIDNGLKSGFLTGVLEQTELSAGDYVMQTQTAGQKFYKVAAAGLKLNANKAYIKAADAPQASGDVKAFSIGTDDETAIQAIDALVNGTAKIYDINGRQLQSLQKGVNIVNGKKVIVK